MIETIVDWDKALFLFLNGLHSGFWDMVMAAISNKYNWIPLYLLFIYWIIRYYKRDAAWIILSLILLVAMIGAIVLTLRHRTDIKRQDILAQIYRERAVELKDVEPGQGV